MNWVPLESKMFTAAAYAAESQVLYLRFRKTGDVYRYFEFPPEQFQEFFNAESHGRYFLSQIKGTFRYERLSRLALVGSP
jgi:hypothetical protein